MDQLMAETRQDLRAIKESLSSIDKNLSLTTQSLTELGKKTIDLEDRVDKIDDHVKFVNAIFRMITVLGGLALFIVEVMPLVQHLFRF